MSEATIFTGEDPDAQGSAAQPADGGRPDLRLVTGTGQQDATPEAGRTAGAPTEAVTGSIGAAATEAVAPPTGGDTTRQPSRRNFLKWSLWGAVTAAVGGGATAVIIGKTESSPGLSGTESSSGAGAGSGGEEKDPKEAARLASANIITYNTNPLYENLPPEEKAIVDKLGQAKWGPGYFDFSLKERRLFAQFMWLGQHPYTEHQVAETNPASYNIPAPVSEGNSAQEIVTQWATRFAELTWVLTRNGGSADPAKRALALKMLEGIYGDESRGSDDYQHRVETLETLGTIDGENDGFQIYTAAKAKKTDKPTPGWRINFYRNGGWRQRHMVLVEFPGVAGMPAEKQWISMRSYDQDDPDYIELS